MAMYPVVLCHNKRRALPIISDFSLTEWNVFSLKDSDLSVVEPRATTWFKIANAIT